LATGGRLTEPYQSGTKCWVVGGQRIFEKHAGLQHQAQNTQKCPGDEACVNHDKKSVGLSSHQYPAVFAIGNLQGKVRGISLDKFFFLAL